MCDRTRQDATILHSESERKSVRSRARVYCVAVTSVCANFSTVASITISGPYRFYSGGLLCLALLV